MPIKCVKSCLGPGTWQWGTRNPRTAIPTQAVPDISRHNPTGHPTWSQASTSEAELTPVQASTLWPCNPRPCITEARTAQGGEAGTEQEERGSPGQTCDRKWPCLWEEQKELIPGAPRVWQRQAYAFTTYQGDVTKRVKLPEALSTLPKPHTGIMGALEDRGSMSNPYTKSPCAPLPLHRAPTCGHKVCIKQGRHR